MTGILGVLAGVGMTGAGTGGGGGGSGSVSISDRTVFKGGNGTTTATATYWIDADGTVRNHNSVILETWLHSGAASDYQAMAQLVSGFTPTFGALNTWSLCSAAGGPMWQLSVPGGTNETSTILVSIRDVATSTVQDSATILLTVTNT